MIYETLGEKLERDLAKTKRHTALGNKRIKAWYLDDVSAPEKLPQLEKAPHQSLLEDGSKAIEFASGTLANLQRRRDHPNFDAELLMYGVGFEKITTAVHLKLKPKQFIQILTSKDGRTPKFTKSRNVMYSDLSGLLGDDQMKALNMTIEIVREHRNNEAHLGFHQHRSFELRTVLLDVSSKLIQQYTQKEFESLNVLLERAEERKEADRGTNWELEFDPEGCLG